MAGVVSVAASLTVAAGFFVLSGDPLLSVVAVFAGAAPWLRARGAVPSRWCYAACAMAFLVGIGILVVQRGETAKQVGLVLVGGAPAGILMLFFVRSWSVPRIDDGTR